MNNKEKNIVPQLRFPNFTSLDTWNKLPLRNYLELLTDFEANGSFSDVKKNVTILDKPDYAWYVRATDLENQSEMESVKYVNKHSYEFLRKTKLYGGELLITKRGEIGKVYIFNPVDRLKATVAPNMYLLKMNEKAIPKFFYYYFSNFQGNQSLKRLNASSTIGALYKDDVKKLDVYIPAKDEQQKIANCLSSLDEVINAETEKLELLQDHKKGLLQQLFPQEGETQPKYRFPEYRNDGDWEETTLDEVFNIYAGGDKPSNISNIKTKEFSIPILSNGVNDKALYGWTNKPKVKIPSLTISARGTIGWTSIQNDPFYPIVRLIVLSPRADLDLNYAYYYMKTIENKYKTPPAGIPQLTKPMIKVVKILIPVSLKEQQKIANCLSSVDELIEAQTQKIESLQNHKKGLLQQLFPNQNDVAV